MSRVGQDQPLSSDGGMDTPRLIARDDLVACLDRAASRKVTIISAPAGSGKTSLLRAWADRPDRAHRLAVVQVRRDEHDAQLFWLALLNAVRQACGTIRDEQLAAMPDFNGRAMVDRMLSELAEHRGRVVLVINDVHELASTESLAQLTRLLANLPSQAHAIVSTRRDLWLGVHQLRLADELAEIRAADLRFSERETGELLAASGVSLSEAGTARLHQRTEGWAAGLRLAVLSPAGGAEPVIAPALVTLAGTMVWIGEFDEADRWLQRTIRALQADIGPDIRLLLHQTTGILQACRGRHHEALKEFSAAEYLQSKLEGPHALAGQVTGWLLATQARLGMTGEARAALAALDDERAGAGEIGDARAVLCLAEGGPAAA